MELRQPPCHSAHFRRPAFGWWDPFFGDCEEALHTAGLLVGNLARGRHSHLRMDWDSRHMAVELMPYMVALHRSRPEAAAPDQAGDIPGKAYHIDTVAVALDRN